MQNATTTNEPVNINITGSTFWSSQASHSCCTEYGCIGTCWTYVLQAHAPTGMHARTRTKWGIIFLF